MNLRDGEIIATMLEDRGLSISDTLSEADIIIVNTCAVRERAVERALGRIKQLAGIKASRPGVIIAVGGCIAQTESDRILREAPFVDIVFGTRKITNLPDMIEKILTNCTERVLDIGEGDVYQEELVGYRFSPISAFISVMRGCNRFCSYCIVPYARGREVYRPEGDILKEAIVLTERGYKEITLIGQNVNAWREGKRGFGNLLERVADETGVFFLRFITSHPANLTDEIIEQFSVNKSLAPSIHLPLQAGSDRILKRMKRGYTIDYYKGLIDRLRKVCPHITITTDIMVGFPGEEEEDFELTLRAVEEIGFDGAYTFKYSPRVLTDASRMPEQVPEEVRLERLRRLIEKVQEVGLERNKMRVGTLCKALIEGNAKRGGLKGRLGSNQVIVLAGDAKVGDIVEVRVKEASYWTLKGEIVKGS